MTTRASVGRDALIPPHPAAAQTPAGGYGIRPYGRRRMPRPTGKRQPCRAANPCRGRCLHRPADPASPQGPGRDKSRPYKPSEMTRQTGTAVTTRATVGRDALIPPDPTAAQTPAGGYGIRPYGRRRMPRPNPGNRGPALQQTPVGDDARIVPRTLRHRKVPGRDKSRPYDRRKARGQPGNGNLAAPQAPVGDDACIVPHPAAAQTPAGGINPAPTIDGRPVPYRGTAPSATNGRFRLHGFSFSSR